MVRTCEAQDGNLWRIPGLHFAGNIVLPSVRPACSGRGPRRKTRRQSSARSRCDRDFLPAHSDHVAHFEVAAFSRLAILANSVCAVSFTVMVSPLGLEISSRRIMNRGDLPNSGIGVRRPALLACWKERPGSGPQSDRRKDCGSAIRNREARSKDSYPRTTSDSGFHFSLSGRRPICL